MLQVEIQSLIDLYKESIGIEAAGKIIYESINESGLDLKESYDEEDIDRICEVLKKRGGFIGIIASVALNAAHAGAYHQKEFLKEKKEKEDLASLKETLEQKVEERTKELKVAQALLVQSAKMTAIGQFAAGAAHEINNPLGGILGYTQLVLSRIEKPDFNPEDFKTCREYLKHIEKESQRCKQIVENLLTFSRKSSETSALQDIKSIMEATFFMLRRSLNLQNIKVSIDYCPDLPLVAANANQLQQVFTNIIVNAMHVMPQGGELNVAVKVVTDEDGRKKIQTVFQDTGCGIPKENLEKIFEPFFTTKQDKKSTGLGLAICNQIIQQHNGKISVSSEVGKGTTFTVMLPC